MRQLPDELLVYDLERHEAHCLNRTAALVFNRADGQTTVRDIAHALRRELNASGGDRLAWLALDRLDRAHLLDDVPTPPAGVAGHSRRDLLRRAGLAAALLPVVSSILVPTVAEAAGTCVQGSVGCAGQDPGTPCYQSFPDDCLGNCSCNASNLCVDVLGDPCE